MNRFIQNIILIILDL